MLTTVLPLILLGLGADPSSERIDRASAMTSAAAKPRAADGTRAHRKWQTFPLKHGPIGERDKNIQMMIMNYARSEPKRPAQLKGLPEGVSESVSYYVAKVAQRELLMAVDPDEKPRLYADTDFDGDLSDEKAVPVLPAENKGTSRPAGRHHFGPIALAAADAKGNAAAKMTAEWRQPGFVFLRPAGCLSGKVRLAGKEHRVVLIDGSCNGRCNDTWSPSGEPMTSWMGDFDIIAVDRNGNGTFDLPRGGPSAKALKEMEVQPLTKALRIEETYYEVNVAADGSKIRLAKLPSECGTLDLGSKGLELMVLCDAGFDYLELPDGKTEVRTGEYMAILSFLSRTDAKGATWKLSGGRGSGKLVKFEIQKGKTLKIKAGPPLVLKTDVIKQPGTVSIGFSAVGQAGEAYAGGAEKDGKRPDAPTLKILDEKGKVLAEGAFKYG